MNPVRFPTVLHYTGYQWDGGGIHTVIRGLAGVHPRSVILGGSPGLQRAGGGPRVWRGPCVEGETISVWNVWRTLRVACRVRRWLARGNGRVFHGHSRAGLLVALWLRALGAQGVMVSVHCHARQRWFYRAVARLLGHRLRWLTPAMKAHYRVGDASWDGCIPNGMSGEPAPLRRWPGGRELRVGAAGLLLPSKRWEVLVRALAGLPASAPVRVRHVGGVFDSEESRACARALRAEAEAGNAAARLTWGEWEADLRPFLASIDVLVVPSELESFSMVALEALWAGVPVIAPRGSGTEHLVRAGTNGWLFPAGDAPALGQVLLACATADAWRDIGSEGNALTRFRLSTVVTQWREAYRGL